MTARSRFSRLLRRFSADERGATAIEYALVAVGIACAIAAAVRLVGSNLNIGFFQRVEEGTRN